MESPLALPFRLVFLAIGHYCVSSLNWHHYALIGIGTALLMDWVFFPSVHVVASAGWSAFFLIHLLPWWIRLLLQNLNLKYESVIGRDGNVATTNQWEPRQTVNPLGSPSKERGHRKLLIQLQPV